MTDNANDPGIETIADIDTVAAVAYGRGIGEALAAMWRGMVEGKLPLEQRELAFEAFLHSRYGYPGVDIGDYVAAEYERVHEEEE